MTEATTVAEITNQKPATLLKAAEPKAIGVVARIVTGPHDTALSD